MLDDEGVMRKDKARKKEREKERNNLEMKNNINYYWARENERNRMMRKKKSNIRREIMFNDVFPGVGIIAITI